MCACRHARTREFEPGINVGIESNIETHSSCPRRVGSQQRSPWTLPQRLFLSSSISQGVPRSSPVHPRTHSFREPSARKQPQHLQPRARGFEPLLGTGSYSHPDRSPDSPIKLPAPMLWAERQSTAVGQYEHLRRSDNFCHTSHGAPRSSRSQTSDLNF